MSKYSDPNPDPKKDSLEKRESPSHLKLVVSNPPPVEKKEPFQGLDQSAGFTAKIKKTGYACYILMVCDPSHYLDCEIPLRICEDMDEELEPKAIVSHFPNICIEYLSEFVEEDETLQSMILIQFQMKVLREILSFCVRRGAPSLFIYTNHTPDGHALKVYSSLATHEHKTPAMNTIGETKMQLTIPINQETLSKFTNLMREINQNFRYMLWEDYSRNPFIRDYLKSNPCLKFFG